MPKALMKKSIIMSMSTLVLASLFTLSTPAPKAEAASCKSNVVSRLVKARFKKLGQQRARANWRKKARKKYGWRYRKWKKAKSKGYYVTVRGQDFRLYRIRAYGTPCK